MLQIQVTIISDLHGKFGNGSVGHPVHCLPAVRAEREPACRVQQQLAPTLRQGQLQRSHHPRGLHPRVRGIPGDVHPGVRVRILLPPKRMLLKRLTLFLVAVLKQEEP